MVLVFLCLFGIFVVGGFINIDHRTVIFVIAVLYSMEERWRGLESSQSFEDILRNRHGISLHRAWLRLKEEGLLGEFTNQFWFANSGGTSVLWVIVGQAFALHHLIRMDGRGGYHLDEATPHTIEVLLRQVEIPIELVQKVATRLNQLLNEQTSNALKSPAE